MKAEGRRQKAEELTDFSTYEHNQIVKTLPDYPGIIADLERDYLEDRSLREDLERKLSLTIAEIELVIAQDEQYRNESMRKAAKTRAILESPDCVATERELKKARHREDMALIRLERHKREFSVLKLQQQMAIAKAADE